MFEGILQSAGERIPERMDHAKGAGVFGYFEVTHDITDRVGNKTPLAARFSPSLQNKGGSDLVNEDRGVLLNSTLRKVTLIWDSTP